MRHSMRLVVLVMSFGAAAGCVAEGDAGPTAALSSVSAGGVPQIADQPAPVSMAAIDVQPRQATYRCDGNQTLTVENLRSSVVLVDPQGESVTLPASPAAQQTRYGQTGYALVLEGKDALYMKGGKPPVNCRR